MTEIDADLEGPISAPRTTGRSVFEAPWEQRVFGLAVALCRSQTCDWESFRQRLIRHITDDADLPYWQNWALALEDVLAETSIVTPSELDVRHRKLLERPAGHDHHR